MKKKLFIVCGNRVWYSILSRAGLCPQDQEKYVEFMINNYEHEQCFDLPLYIFDELKEDEVLIDEEYEADRQKGIEYVLDKYTEKRYWNESLNTGPHYYIVKKEYSRRGKDLNLNVIRMLLELELVVYRDCESGEVYLNVLF